MGGRDLMRYHSAALIFEADEKLSNIHASSFSDFKKETQKNIINQIKSVRRHLVAKSKGVVNFKSVLEHIKRASSGR